MTQLSISGPLVLPSLGAFQQKLDESLLGCPPRSLSIGPCVVGGAGKQVGW